ncbi:hypothetical protein [Galactobacillus timonensis]|uniref:hypothetical protein n=1 Tax=Galactobacillus timonensis TaxID=2041840 RepID=UPI000C8155FC|nr:hypothetical protein [Galactobacillus timonensis]
MDWLSKFINKLKKDLALDISDEEFKQNQAIIAEWERQHPEEYHKHFNSWEEKVAYAKAHVTNPRTFEEITADYNNVFHTLDNEDYVVAILIGVVAYGVAYSTDDHGKDLEKGIDDMLPKDYDKNNPFDMKEGWGHRVFGHDVAAFPLKNIPGNYALQIKVSKYQTKSVRIADYIGQPDAEYVSMLDLVWFFYGNDDDKLKGIFNCLAHIFVHFAKDLCTPAGLPLPFVSLGNTYREYEHVNFSTLPYRDSLMAKLDKAKLNMKMSDFASFATIEILSTIVCHNKQVENKECFLREIRLIAMGTCISVQMASILLHKDLITADSYNPNKIIPGARVNALMTADCTRLLFKEAMDFSKQEKEIMGRYQEISKSTK